MAPVHGGAKGPLSLWQVPRAARQQLQPARQARQHRRGRKNFDSGGRKLDRERETVQPGANLGDGTRIFQVEFEVRLGGYGALQEQSHGGVL